MLTVADELKRIEIDLGEWKEELGDQFPSFLNYALVSRVMKLNDEIKYLRARIDQQSVFHDW